MGRYQNIVILTGAGVSAESGISTFRDKDGIWAKYDYREVATPEGFARNPDLVYAFYNWRRQNAQTVVPNAAHVALAELEQHVEARGGRVLLVTQNVDPLHEMAGSRNLLHMHGELLSCWCRHCDRRNPWKDDLSGETPCPNCARAGAMRPDIVWFGEMPYHMDAISAALDDADLFMSIGTSGNVYPAAGFVRIARDAGAHTVELNLEPSSGASLFAERIHGHASVIVPAFVERLVNS